MAEVWFDIGVVVLLLVIGGLFTATELALVSLRAGQLQGIGRRRIRGGLAGRSTCRAAGDLGVHPR